MALDQATIDKVTNWINTKWTNKNCVLCTSNAWALNGFVVLSLGDQPHNVVLGGQHLPSVALICKTCGNTIIVNLVIAGIVPGAK